MQNAPESATVTRLLTYAEVADRLRITKRHVYNLVRDRKLVAIRFGRSVRFTEQHLADFLATHEIVPADGDVPGQLELDLDLPSGSPASTTPTTPVETQLAA